MHMKTVFEGTDFDPLSQGDPVCTSLIRNAARDITYTCAEGKGIVEGIISRPLPTVYSYLAFNWSYSAMACSMRLITASSA